MPKSVKGLDSSEWLASLSSNQMIKSGQKIVRIIVDCGI